MDLYEAGAAIGFNLPSKHLPSKRQNGLRWSSCCSVQSVYSDMILYFAMFNVLGYILICADKSAARAQRRRVPERTLFLTAFLGGAIGIRVAMSVVRHKTKHAAFVYGVPMLIVWNVVAAWYVSQLTAGLFKLTIQ